MELYFAPMEGITIYSFRQVHHRFFPGMDRYYSPFLVATQTHSFKKREIREILPENNQGICLIPQILGNHAEDCLEAIRTLSSYGYREINFNLGCSMPQVSKRGRGAGFLARPQQLDRFFEELFDGMEKEEALSDVRLSVKTRIGDSESSVVGKFRDMGQVESPSGNRGLYSSKDGTGKIWVQEEGGKIIRYRCYSPDASHWWQLEYRTNAAGSVTSIDMLFEP